ncbi:MAG: ATP-binding protein [Thermodesulfobacteriota bacterium]
MPAIFRLRLKIFFTLLFFLGLAMLLSDLVLTLQHQKELVQGEVVRAGLAARLVRQRLAVAPAGQDDWSHLGRDLGPDISLRLVLAGSQVHDTTNAQGRLAQRLSGLVAAVEKNQQGRQLFVRGGFSLLGRQHLALLTAQPLGRGGVLVLVSDLARVRQGLVARQRLFFAYLFLNLTVLTLLAYQRLARFVIRPLQRLMHQADTYRDEEDFLFRPGMAGDDFASLSSSLNAMLGRISRDREKRQTMVRELEGANTALCQAQEEVIRAEKLASVGRLSAGLAHEIGNPLGIVLGYLEMVEDLPEEERADCLARGVAEIQRINTILRQLLDLARPQEDAGQEVVAVHQLISDVCQGPGLGSLLGGMAVKLDLGASGDRVRGDGEKLRQVFLNLLLNSADACREQESPQLQISSRNSKASPPGGGAAIEIVWRDNGSGIAPADRETLFDPFFTTKEPGHGTGLGLSVSYMIIEGLGGKISAASPGRAQGATFTITLPLLAEADGKV